MKRLIAILLIGILALTGCEKQSTITQEAKEYGYFNFENLEWGMTPAEVMKKLGKKENDFTIKDNYTINDRSEVIFTLEDTKYKGYNATISYYFWGISNSPQQQFLCNVIVGLNDELTENDLKLIGTEIVDEIDDYGVKLLEDTFPIEGDYSRHSMAKSHDLPKELQNKANAYVRKLFRELEYEKDKPMIIDVEKYQYTVSSSQPLSSVEVMNSISAEDEKPIFEIIFQGEIGKIKGYAMLAEEAGIE